MGDEGKGAPTLSHTGARRRRRDDGRVLAPSRGARARRPIARTWSPSSHRRRPAQRRYGRASNDTMEGELVPVVGGEGARGKNHAIHVRRRGGGGQSLCRLAPPQGGCGGRSGGAAAAPAHTAPHTHPPHPRPRRPKQREVSSTVRLRTRLVAAARRSAQRGARIGRGTGRRARGGLSTRRGAVLPQPCPTPHSRAQHLPVGGDGARWRIRSDARALFPPGGGTVPVGLPAGGGWRSCTHAASRVHAREGGGGEAPRNRHHPLWISYESFHVGRDERRGTVPSEAAAIGGARPSGAPKNLGTGIPPPQVGGWLPLRRQAARTGATLRDESSD